jgi:hypothetical protein
MSSSPYLLVREPFYIGKTMEIAADSYRHADLRSAGVTEMTI